MLQFKGATSIVTVKDKPAQITEMQMYEEGWKRTNQSEIQRRD